MFTIGDPSTQEAENKPVQQSPIQSIDSVTPKFNDVKEDAYYAQAVAWAVEKNITAGTSKTTFSPDTTCTRGQIVTFLLCALK